jgi:hypothetical protein
MKRFASCALLLPAVLSLAAAKPLATVKGFNGKFTWIKLAGLSAKSIRSLSTAKSIVFEVTFQHDVKVQKDSRGFQWFTFIVADQGSDWKWNQTTGNGPVKVTAGVVKAGTYTVSVPVGGIPKSVLRDSKQTISVGPGSSGLAGTASFSVDRLRGG